MYHLALLLCKLRVFNFKFRAHVWEIERMPTFLSQLDTCSQSESQRSPRLLLCNGISNTKTTTMRMDMATMRMDPATMRNSVSCTRLSKNITGCLLFSQMCGLLTFNVHVLKKPHSFIICLLLRIQDFV